MTTSTSTTPLVGTPMPLLELVDRAGNRTTLAHERDGRRAVVYFLRTASCPVCGRHARVLAEMAEAGELGPDVRVLLVAPGGAQEAAVLAARIASSAVTVRASGDGHAAAGLGTFLSVQHSGTFVVGEDGAVVYTRTAALPPQAFSRTELLAALHD